MPRRSPPSRLGTDLRTISCCPLLDRAEESNLTLDEEAADEEARDPPGVPAPLPRADSLIDPSCIEEVRDPPGALAMAPRGVRLGGPMSAGVLSREEGVRLRLREVQSDASSLCERTLSNAPGGAAFCVTGSQR